MINIYINDNKIIIETDSIEVKYLLEFKKIETVFQPWIRQWRDTEVVSKLYEEKRIKPNKQGIYKFTLRLGWIAYIANVFKSMISQESYIELLRHIYSDSYRESPFPGLRDYQNQDVLHILKYRLGLVTVNTGYGKTQVIATLANYAYNDLGKKVLIIAPGKKAKDEIIKRYNTLFGYEIPTSIDGNIGCIITNGLLNQKKFKDPKLLPIEEAKLRKFEWVLVDEVEYTVGSASGEFLYSRLTGADHFYGFSGSADKWGGNMISFANGIDETVIRNKDLVKYFGPSLVHRMPLNLKIDNITIKTSAFDNIEFTKNDFAEDSNVYFNIMSKIWVHPDICNLIIKLGKTFPMLYIPINNLSNIISTWINNYFIGVFRVLLIRGSKQKGDEGYIYYDLNGNITNLNLVETCEYIKNGMVDIIPSTSAGFRALDLPNLENILLISGINAGTVLQTIGRTARGKHMNIIALEPKSGAKVPIYTKGFEHRNKMVHNYYKYCEIHDIIINEENI